MAKPNPRKPVPKSMAAVLVSGGSGNVSLTLFDKAKTEALARSLGPGELLRGEAFRDPARQREAMEAVQGILVMEANPWCQAYEILGAAADKGYGPALYDTALTFVLREKRLAGIVPDRHSVSPDAVRVWAYMNEKRPDVKSREIPLLCRAHKDPALNRIYMLTEPFPDYPKLLARGRELTRDLQAILGDDGFGYTFLAAVRAIFWNCKYHKECPGPFPGSDAPAPINYMALVDEALLSVSAG